MPSPLSTLTQEQDDLEQYLNQNPGCVTVADFVNADRSHEAVLQSLAKRGFYTAMVGLDAQDDRNKVVLWAVCKTRYGEDVQLASSGKPSEEGLIWGRVVVHKRGQPLLAADTTPMIGYFLTQDFDPPICTIRNVVEGYNHDLQKSTNALGFVLVECGYGDAGSSTGKVYSFNVQANRLSKLYSCEGNVLSVTDPIDKTITVDERSVENCVVFDQENVLR